MPTIRCARGPLVGVGQTLHGRRSGRRRPLRSEPNHIVRVFFAVIGLPTPNPDDPTPIFVRGQESICLTFVLENPAGRAAFMFAMEQS